MVEKEELIKPLQNNNINLEKVNSNDNINKETVTPKSNTKFCKYCGAKFNANANFGNSCGKSLVNKN